MALQFCRKMYLFLRDGGQVRLLLATVVSEFVLFPQSAPLQEGPTEENLLSVNFSWNLFAGHRHGAPTPSPHHFSWDRCQVLSQETLLY